MREALVVAILLQPCLFLMGMPAFAQADTTPTNAASPAASSLVNDVSTLETSVYGQPTSDALAARVSHLELTTLGSAQSGSLRSRVDSLQKLIEKNEPANQLKGQVAEDTSLHLDPAIEDKLPAPYKTEARVSIPATTAPTAAAELQADSSNLQHPTAHNARRFGRELGVALGTTLKAAAVLAGAALAASATTTAYSGSAMPSASYGELGMHRDLCACHYYIPPAPHYYHHHH